MRKLSNRNLIIIYGLVMLLFIGTMIYFLMNGGVNRQTPTELTTNEFVTAVKQGRVLDVTFVVNDNRVTGTFLPEGQTDKTQALPFTSFYVGSDSLNTLMADHPNVTFRLDTSSNALLQSLLPTLLIVLLLFAFGWFMFSRMESANNKQLQFGRSKARKAHEERPTTKFSDVAGIDEVVEELQEVKDFLADPERYRRFGAKIPRGVLLVGPPGTGKTLLARAVAGEAGVPFFSISGSDFVEMFVGVGASRVRDLFEQAKAAAPAIIFIDEIDAVGRQRGAGLGGGHDEREQTLNQLLVEMDGFADHQSVILIAATNRPDILDPALLRPGRFDRQITVMRPDLKGREAILRVHSQNKPLAHSVDLATLARMTPGFTGADLANLMNEAALLAARRAKKLITMNELTEAMERAIAGPERKSRIMTEKEKRTIAYHESGHALVGHILEYSDPVHKISIISRGQALGYTMSLPTEDRFLTTRNEMMDDLAVFMGGRVAEELFCDDITTGASNDLERATTMARQMVTQYGMTEALGNQVYGQTGHDPFLGRDYTNTPDYSEVTAQRIDETVAQIMANAHQVAHGVLSTRREQIDLMAEVLLERETVEGEALEALLNNRWAEYLEQESDILARKAEELRQQEEEDARLAAEAERRHAEERAAAGLAVANTEDEPAPPKPPSLADILSGKVDLDDMMKGYRGEQPPNQNPPRLPDALDTPGTTNTTADATSATPGSAATADNSNPPVVAGSAPSASASSDQLESPDSLATLPPPKGAPLIAVTVVKPGDAPVVVQSPSQPPAPAAAAADVSRAATAPAKDAAAQPAINEQGAGEGRPPAAAPTSAPADAPATATKKRSAAPRKTAKKADKSTEAESTDRPEDKEGEDGPSQN